MFSVLEDEETERIETRMKAAEWLADRGFGKAPVALEAGGGGPTTIVVRSAFGPAIDELDAG
jgi:hypothetical protein